MVPNGYEFHKLSVSDFFYFFSFDLSHIFLPLLILHISFVFKMKYCLEIFIYRITIQYKNYFLLIQIACLLSSLKCNPPLGRNDVLAGSITQSFIVFVLGTKRYVAKMCTKAART